MTTPYQAARGAVLATALFAVPLFAPPVFAQTFGETGAGTDSSRAVHGFWLTAEHPDIAVAPGKDASFPLRLMNATATPRRSALTVKGLPEGWQFTLKAGGTDVSSSMVLPKDTDRLTLEVTPAPDAAKKTYGFEVDAKSDAGTETLPLSVAIADIPMGQTTLVPELPALKGTAKTTFDYKMKLKNGGTKDALFTLAADAPQGFQTTFKHGYGSEEITGVPVKAGATENVTLEVKADRSISAGDYPIAVSAVAGPDAPSAEAKVTLEVTGSPTLSLSGADGRLSGEATAGAEATFPFVVANTGSAPADHVKLTGSAPSGWKVGFSPKELPMLAPGEQQKVTVKVTPAGKAIAGDYMVSLNSAADGASDRARFRVTVETSTVWGIVGVLIIAIAVLVLVGAVFRYGRR